MKLNERESGCVSPPRVKCLPTCYRLSLSQRFKLLDDFFHETQISMTLDMKMTHALESCSIQTLCSQQSVVVMDQ